MCPDLPGHGSDPTPAGEITLASYVDCVARVLGGLEQPAVVVGHSFGGAVVSQTCEQVPESVALAVYLCAFLLRDGQSVWRHGVPAPRSTSTAPGVLAPANLRVDEKNATVDLERSVIEEAFYAGCSAREREQAMANWRAEPLAPLRTPLNLNGEHYGGVPRIYIQCRRDLVFPLASQERMCRLTRCAEIKMEWGHSPFLSHPEDLAGLLSNL